MARVYSSALITGASSGIGAAFARALPFGAGVVLTGRDGDALAALAAELSREDRAVEIVAADLATEAGRAAVIERAEAGDIDLLVNNAGIGCFGPMIENDPATERAMAEVNVTAVVVLTRALLPGMIARAKESGSRAGLIVVSSILGFTAVPYFATYAASKTFDLHFAEALAEELVQEPVDVLAVCPGSTRSKFHARAGMRGGDISHAHTPERVAAEALETLGKRTVHLVGARNRTAARLLRLLPRRTTARLMGKVLWRRYRGSDAP